MSPSVRRDASRSIRVPVLTRVEGEGAVEVRIRKGKLVDLKVRIYEPPRFFESFLRGRLYAEAPDITARICGICPVAYQMSAVQAIERAFGVEVDRALRDLRRLLYCGEWIESHALHVVMLHAPDFLGLASGIELAQLHPEIATRGLAIKKTGNDIVRVIGGREIHPISLKVGGFHRVPSRRELAVLREPLLRAREDSLALVRWVSRLPIPEFQRDYCMVALGHETEYPLGEGRVISSHGHSLDASEYEAHFSEEHVEHSNALHSMLDDVGEYLVGPLARYSLNFAKLSPLAQEAARDAGLGPTCRNPFQSIVVRAVETVWAVDEALRLVDRYEPPAEPSVPVEVRESTGWAVTEAPRGILYHRYSLGADGLIREARIVPPTAQNLRTIESDVRQWVESHLGDETDVLTHGCEHTVRNYDPCISCATHFLRVVREG